MHPYLFHGTAYQVATWDVFFWLATVTTFIVGVFIINPKDFQISKKIRIIGFFSLLLIVPIGAKIASVLLNLRFYLAGQRVLLPTFFLRGADASMGSYVFYVCILFIITKKLIKGVGFRQILDFAMPLCYLQFMIGRIGCFFNGCCCGTYTKLPWGVKFNGSVVPRHPTQLYSVIVLGFVIIMTIAVYRKKAPPGTAFFSSLSMYSFLRFFIELIRVDSFEIFNKIMFAPVFMMGLCIVSTAALILNLKLGMPRDRKI